MRRMIILAGALACLPMAAHAQSGGADWDTRGDWVQTGSDWRDGGSDHNRFDRGRNFDESHDSRSGWRDQGRSRDDDGMDRGGRGMGRMGRGDMDHGGMGGMGDMSHHGMMMRHGMMGRGAAFMLRAGDVRLAVRCSPEESMKACVDAATDLMDRAKSMSTGSSSSSSTTAPPAGVGSGSPGSSGSSSSGTGSPGSAGTPPKP